MNSAAMNNDAANSDAGNGKTGGGATHPNWRGYWVCGVFALLALASVFAHRAAAPLLLLLAFAAPPPRLIYAQAREVFPPPIKSWYGMLIYAAFAFVVWTAITALWSPLPEKIDWSWRYGFAFFVSGLAFYAVTQLSDGDKKRAAAGFAWAVAAMAALLVFERLTGGLLRELAPPDHAPGKAQISLGRGALIVMILVWPAREIFARHLSRPLISWGLIAAAAIVATGFSIETNAAALAVGFCAFFIARAFPSMALKIVFSVLIASIWLAPFAAAAMPVDAVGEALSGLPTSWLQRLYIWHYAGTEILTSPLGGGVDYARSLSAGAPHMQINGVDGSLMPLHPHNLALHFWIDLGVVGAGLLTAALMAIYRAIRSAGVSAAHTPLICAVMMSFFVSAMTEWSLWQVWRFALCWFAAIGVALAVGAPRACNQRGAR